MTVVVVQRVLRKAINDQVLLRVAAVSEADTEENASCTVNTQKETKITTHAPESIQGTCAEGNATSTAKAPSHLEKNQGVRAACEGGEEREGVHPARKS